MVMRHGLRETDSTNGGKRADDRLEVAIGFINFAGAIPCYDDEPCENKEGLDNSICRISVGKEERAQCVALCKAFVMASLAIQCVMPSVSVPNARSFSTGGPSSTLLAVRQWRPVHEQKSRRQMATISCSMSSKDASTAGAALVEPPKAYVDDASVSEEDIAKAWNKSRPDWAGGHLLSWLLNKAIETKPIYDLLVMGARRTLINTAEKNGVMWRQEAKKLEASQASSLLKQVEDPRVEYPAYYRNRFHCYENGNLGWDAAFEVESATKSMALRVWPAEALTTGVAQKRMRECYMDICRDYYTRKCAPMGGSEHPASILDVGCGPGISTRFFAEAFPQSHVTGLDLSPYFLSVAKFRDEAGQADETIAIAGRPPRNHSFVHAAAEDTKLPGGSVDMAALVFVAHELPQAATRAILREMHRVVRPGGMIALVDVNPRSPVIQNLPTFLFTAMKASEPYSDEYYTLDIVQALQDAGFSAVEYKASERRHIIASGASSLGIGSTTALSVHLWTAPPKDGDMDTNFKAVEHAAQRVSPGSSYRKSQSDKTGSDPWSPAVLVFPELFATGVLPLKSMVGPAGGDAGSAWTSDRLQSWTSDRLRSSLSQAYRDMSFPGHGSGIVGTRLRDIAKRSNVTILLPYLETAPGGGQPFSSAMLAGSDGRSFTNYRRSMVARQGVAPTGIHAFLGTPPHGEKGGRGPVVDIHGVKVGVVIGADLHLPETARAAAIRGSQLLLVPAAISAHGSCTCADARPTHAAGGDHGTSGTSADGTAGDHHVAARDEFLGCRSAGCAVSPQEDKLPPLHAQFVQVRASENGIAVAYASMRQTWDAQYDTQGEGGDDTTVAALGALLAEAGGGALPSAFRFEGGSHILGCLPRHIAAQGLTVGGTVPPCADEDDAPELFSATLAFPLATVHGVDSSRSPLVRLGRGVLLMSEHEMTSAVAAWTSFQDSDSLAIATSGSTVSNRFVPVDNDYVPPGPHGAHYGVFTGYKRYDFYLAWTIPMLCVLAVVVAIITEIVWRVRERKRRAAAAAAGTLEDYDLGITPDMDPEEAELRRRAARINEEDVKDISFVTVRQWREHQVAEKLRKKKEAEEAAAAAAAKGNTADGAKEVSKGGDGAAPTGGKGAGVQRRAPRVVSASDADLAHAGGSGSEHSGLDGEDGDESKKKK
eukprot:jgi/Mesvir1/13445/Mv16511-RA.1